MFGDLRQRLCTVYVEHNIKHTCGVCSLPAIQVIRYVVCERKPLRVMRPQTVCFSAGTAMASFRKSALKFAVKNTTV